MRTTSGIKQQGGSLCIHCELRCISVCGLSSANYIAAMMGISLPVIAVVLLALCLDPAFSSHNSVCYQLRSRYVARSCSYTSYYSEGYGHGYRCGGWWRRRTCYRTAYRAQSRQSYRNCGGTEYYSEFGCCAGYRQVGRSCRPICPSGCANGGTCVHPNTCDCNTAPGYKGTVCSVDCDECIEGTSGCDHMCNNTIGSYICSCRDGFILNPDQHTCDDIDECADDSTYSSGCNLNGLCDNNGCDINGFCDNIPGSFRCLCNTGYEFSDTGIYDLTTNVGRGCRDVDECATANGGCDHNCHNTEASFYCSCNDGYELLADNMSCLDINECETGAHNCTGLAQCVNELGYFRCICPDGYEINETDYASCKDIDECATGVSGCSHICTNTIGSHFCSCLEDRYTLDVDDRTCLDINECNTTNMGGCEYICINTIGSFYCECARGFTLEPDGFSCRALQCPTLTAPRNGSVSCTSQMTGGSCSFDCDTGYTLRGSRTRFCRPSVTWSGSPAFCDPLLCEPPLQPPENGIILPPCRQEYTSSCIIECVHGYKINGTTPFRQTCVLNEMEEAIWTEPPVCVVSDVCTTNSNPACEHGGNCTATDSTNFVCDCEGTGYRGKTCNIGIMRTPEIPPIIVDQLSRPLDITASPDEELTIAIEGGDEFDVTPANITIRSPQKGAQFQLRGVNPGHTTLSYVLSGPSTDSFNKPGPTSILVSKSRPGISLRYFTALETSHGQLIESCCVPADILFQCPMSTEEVHFQSSCQWTSSGSSYTTTGVVFSRSRGLSIPLSVAGIYINISRAMRSLYAELPEVSVSSCTPCESNRGNEVTERRTISSLPPEATSCYYYSYDVPDLQDFLLTNSLVVTYLSRIDPLIPPWLHLILLGRSNAFGSDDYLTILAQREDIQGVEGCENVQADDLGLYSILRYNRFMRVIISGQTEVYRADASLVPVCFAVNLCKGTDSPLYIGLSPSAQGLVQSLNFFTEYTDRDWDFTIFSAALFNTLARVTVDGMYWNGRVFYRPQLPAFDLLVRADATMIFSSGRLQTEVELSGTAYYVYNHHEERNAVLDGVTLTITTQIGGTSANLVLTDSSSPTVVFISENGGTCDEGVAQSGASFKLLYQPRAGQDFFSNLFSLTDQNLECPMDVFMNLDSDTHLQGLSTYTDCPRLLLQRLIFTDMAHKLYFTTATDACLPQPDLPEDTPDYAILIHSSMKRNRLPLGSFLTLLPGDNSIALTVAFATDSPGSYARMHSVNVSMFGTQFNTPVDINNDMLEFTAKLDIFKLYPTDLDVSASITNVPWNRLVFSVDGDLVNDPTDPRSLPKIIEDYVQDSINSTTNNAKQRQLNGEMAVTRACGNLDNLQMEYISREQRLLEANVTYQEALDNLTSAEATLASAETAFESANDDILEAQGDLSNVCDEADCEDIEVCSQRCNMCQRDVFVEQTGLCNTTVNVSMNVTEITYQTREGWRWTRICNTRCFRSCYTYGRTTCWTYCNSKCLPFQETYPVRTSRTIYVRETQLKPCPPQRYSHTVTDLCCNQTVCQSAPNVVCQELCREQRARAIENLQKTRADIAEPFSALERARTGLSSAQVALSRATARRDSAQQMFEQIQPAYESTQTAKDVSEKNYQDVLAGIKGELALARLIEGQASLDSIFNITSVTFNISITTHSPMQLPLVITYDIPAREQTYQENIVFDFSAPLQFNLRVISDAVHMRVLDTASISKKRSLSYFNVRGKRQTALESERDPNTLTFEANCVEVMNLRGFFNDLVVSLEEINQGIVDAKSSISATQSQAEVDPSVYTPRINYDVLESVFNVSTEEANVTNKDNDVIKAYEELVQEYERLAVELSASIGNTSFIEWQATMEVLYNITRSVSDHPCAGFTDCLSTALTVLKQLLKDLPTSSDTEELLLQLLGAEKAVLELGTAMNLTIPNSLDRLQPVTSILEADTIVNYWCSSPPNITTLPPLEASVQEGDDLVLNCSAESQLPVTYQWTKNGNLIPDADSNNLVISALQKVDSGNYTCCVSNPVATIKSPYTSLFVYELPTFYLEPTSVAVYTGDRDGAWFGCNATAWPFPGWKWYFRPTEDSQWTLIEGEDANELLVPTPRKENEGWYTCEAYNRYGSLQAKPVYLTILPLTVSQFGIPVEFKMVPVTDDCSSETLKEAVNITMQTMIDLKTVSIDDLSVKIEKGVYVVSFMMVSQNATTDQTQFSPIAEIENIALPSRSDVINARESLESLVQKQQLLVECNDVEFRVLPSSLTFEGLTYLCPPGQELHINYLFCVGCAPGTYQTTLARERIFDGEGLKEQFPTCQPCPMSHYEDRIGSIECQACPEYYRTNFTGAASSSDCFTDPLLIDCYASGSSSHITIDCRTNKPLETVLCSFDGGLEHPCELPLVVNTQSFSGGSHSVSIIASDESGFTAEDTVEYILQNDTRTFFRPDVPPLILHFVNDSPRITGNTVEADFVITRHAYSVKCQISRHQEKECSSGNVVFTDLEPGRYTLRVAAGNSKEDKVIERRRFEITSDPSFCTVHLINDGVTVRDGGGATVEFTGTGPAEGFSCRLDREQAFNCTSPVDVSGGRTGEHQLKILPLGCGENRRQLLVEFTN